DGPRHRAHGPGHHGRGRHRGRASRHPAHAEPGDRQHLRGHPRHPHPDRRARYHRPRRLRRLIEPDGPTPAGGGLGMSLGANLQDGEQVLLLDERGRRHLFLLRKGETFHSDRGFLLHDTIIDQPDGTWVRTSRGTRYLALRPTLAEYVLDMPRGAQVIYPKDLAVALFWADVFPGARVLEAGMCSGA